METYPSKAKAGISLRSKGKSTWKWVLKRAVTVSGARESKRKRTTLVITTSRPKYPNFSNKIKYYRCWITDGKWRVKLVSAPPLSSRAEHSEQLSMLDLGDFLKWMSFRMQQECGVCLVPKTNEVTYHLLGECIKNDPAEVYWESTEQTSKPSHVWSYYTNKGGRTLETETCTSAVIHFAAFTLTLSLKYTINIQITATCISNVETHLHLFMPSVFRVWWFKCLTTF